MAYTREAIHPASFDPRVCRPLQDIRAEDCFNDAPASTLRNAATQEAAAGASVCDVTVWRDHPARCAAVDHAANGDATGGGVGLYSDIDMLADQ